MYMFVPTIDRLLHKEPNAHVPSTKKKKTHFPSMNWKTEKKMS